MLNAFKRNVNPVELFFVLIFVGVFATGCTRAMVKDATTDSAKKYVQEMGYGEFLGSSSPGTDADGDGYVSIDVRVRDGNGQERTLNLECTYSHTGIMSTGCKEKVVINKQK